MPLQALAENNFSLTISNQLISSLGNTDSRLFRTSVTELILPTSKGSKTLQLSQIDIRSANYQSLLSTRRGQVQDSSKVTLFKGIATEQSKDQFEFYRFALIDDGKTKPYLDGYFLSGGTYYTLKRENTGAEYLVNALTEEDYHKIIASCGTIHQHQVSLSQLSRTSSQANITTLKTVEIATDADYEYYLAEGASNAQILSILNGVDAIYRNQLNLTLSVVFQNVWTTPSDPYTSTVPSNLLNEMRGYWETYFTSRRYDVAHLFTARDLDGGVVGIAYISAVCGSFRYGLSQRLASAAYDVALTAHELGHNMGSNHDDCPGSEQFLMCPILVPYGNTFSSQSVNSIANLVNQVSCLNGGSPTPTPTPTPPPGNSAPVLSGIGPRTIREGQSLSIALSASDVNGDALSYSVTANAFGSLSGSNYSFFAPVGTVPSGSSSLRYDLVFRVSDGSLSDSETVAITLTKAPAANQPPTFNNPGAVYVSEGDVLQFRLDASDPENGQLRFASSSRLPAGLTLNPQSGLISWRPLGNQSGPHTIDLVISDPAGLSVSGSFTIVAFNVDSVQEMPLKHHLGDYDGDGVAELSLFRSHSAEWFSKRYDAEGYNYQQWGISGDVPVPGDYNGDNITDLAVFRPSNSTWYIRTSGDNLYLEVPFGSTGDLPVAAGDYDGDGRDDLAIFRSSIGSFVYRGIFGSENFVNIGQRGDIPVVCDYNGDGSDDVAVYRPSAGRWFVNVNGSQYQVALGANNDIPLAGDIRGNGSCELIVYRPATAEWITQNGVYDVFGSGGDTPVLADLDGDGDDDLALWRAAEANWYLNLNNGRAIQFGLFRDTPVTEVAKKYAFKNSRKLGVVGRGLGYERAYVYSSRSRILSSLSAAGSSTRSLSVVKGSYIFKGDYDGDSQLDLVFYNKGKWTIRYASGASNSFVWGVASDLPVQGDFDGDLKSDAAIYRNGQWHIISSLTGELLRYDIGAAGDMPIPADYNGDGRTDPAVVNRTTFIWKVVDARSNSPMANNQWGIAGDIPVVADFDNDGKADLVAYRPVNRTWYIKLSGGNEVFIKWGKAGDVPIAGNFASANAIDLAVFRPSTGQLLVRSFVGQTATYSIAGAKRGQLVDRSVLDAIR